VGGGRNDVAVAVGAGIGWRRRFVIRRTTCLGAAMGNASVGCAARTFGVTSMETTAAHHAHHDMRMR